MGEFSWMSDDELLVERDRARSRAHDAKQQNSAARANDWVRLATECDRRGISTPAGQTGDEG